MFKMKTHSGMKKRVKMTGGGKFKHKKQNLRHILTKKTSKRKRHLRNLEVMSSAEAHRMRRLMGM